MESHTQVKGSNLLSPPSPISFVQAPQTPQASFVEILLLHLLKFVLHAIAIAECQHVEKIERGYSSQDYATAYSVNYDTRTRSTVSPSTCRLSALLSYVSSTRVFRQTFATLNVFTDTPHPPPVAIPIQDRTVQKVATRSSMH